MAPQQAAGLIGPKPRRQNHSASPALSQQTECPLREELVEVCVSAALKPELSRTPDKAREIRALRAGAVVSDHVPRRISEHDVEARVWQRAALAVVEHFGKLQCPVKKPLVFGDLVNASEVRIAHVRWQRL